MTVHRINHITLNSSDLAKTCAFYADVLGFSVEEKEGRGLTGAWLSADGHAFLHLIARRPDQAPETRGLVDHFALEATGIAETRRHLESIGVPYHENTIPELDAHQIVVKDPDGVKVELYFRGQAA
jgi:lactoylglutathione lyase